MMTIKRTVAAVLATVTTLGSVGCGQTSDIGAAGGTVTVFADASLTESFGEIGRAFEAANPGTEVTFTFLGSSTLAQQINQGASVDVYASASPATMAQVVDAGNGEGTPTVVARNQLVVAVPSGNPGQVTGLADLVRPGVKVALCAEQVPCGAAAQKALQAAGVALTPVTLQPDVKATLTKLRLGEVDAALVYRTDVRAAESDVDAVEFPESAETVNEYPIIVLKNAPNQALARAFVAFVRSERGWAALSRAGFQEP